LTDAVPSVTIPVTDQLLVSEMTYADLKEEIPWINILSLIYLVGLTFFLFRYLYGLYQLRCIIHSTEQQSVGDGIIVCLSDRKIESFSWFGYIVISITDYSAVEDDQKRVLNVSTFKGGEVLTFGDFNNAVIFIDGKKSSLEQLQQLHSSEIKGLAASPSNLDFESDLHKKYRISSDKIIVEVTR
jgi:hypothetical protein